MNQGKIKVLFVHHAAGIGGAPLSLLYMIQALDRNVFDVKVLFLKDSKVVDIFKDSDIDIVVVKNHFYKKFYDFLSHSKAKEIKWYRVYKIVRMLISWILSALIFAPKILDNEKADIIHLNSSVLTDWVFAGKRKGLKVVCHVREPLSSGLFGIRLNFIRFILQKYSDIIIAISKDNARRIGLPLKTKVIYNFVKELESASEINSNDSYFLYMGGAAKIKGFYLMIDSLPYLDENIRILFAGKYPHESSKSFLGSLHKNKFKSYLEKMRSSTHVVEVGIQENIGQMISKSIAILCPFSVPHFPRPVIEAFSLKKTVIVSDVEGMDELVKHKFNGLVVNKNDAMGLAQAINYIYNNKEVAMEMGNRGYENSANLFSLKNIVQIEEIYIKLKNEE